MRKLGLNFEQNISIEAVEFGDEVASVVDADVGDDGVAVNQKRVRMVTDDLEKILTYNLFPGNLKVWFFTTTIKVLTTH